MSHHVRYLITMLLLTVFISTALTWYTLRQTPLARPVPSPYGEQGLPSR